MRPRAADDFATIRARMEELRRERAQAVRGSGHSEDVGSARRLLKRTEGRLRSASERGPAAPSGRRYGSER